MGFSFPLVCIFWKLTSTRIWTYKVPVRLLTKIVDTSVSYLSYSHGYTYRSSFSVSITLCKTAHKWQFLFRKIEYCVVISVICYKLLTRFNIGRILTTWLFSLLYKYSHPSTLISYVAWNMRYDWLKSPLFSVHPFKVV